MSIEERKVLLSAMKTITERVEYAQGVGLRKLFNAYNYLHVQLDGTKIQYPTQSQPLFVYDKNLQMVRGG